MDQGLAEQTPAPGEQHAMEEDEYEDEEETEQSEDDEELNLRFFGIRQALPLPEGEPDWDAGPPDSAEEYLRRVRAEAAACPRVVRVEFDAEAHAAKQRARAAAAAAVAASDVAAEQGPGSSQGAAGQPREPGLGSDDAAAAQQGQLLQGLSAHQAASHEGGAPRSVRVAGYVSRLLAAGQLQEGPDWAQPSHTWVRQLVADFRNMRLWLMQASEAHAAELQRSARLPSMQDEAAWDQICFGGRSLGVAPVSVHVRQSRALAPIPTTASLAPALHGSKQHHSRKRHHPTHHDQVPQQQEHQQVQQGPGQQLQPQQELQSQQVPDPSCQTSDHQAGLQTPPQPPPLPQSADASAAGSTHTSSSIHNSSGGSTQPAASSGLPPPSTGAAGWDHIAVPVLSTVLCIDQVGVATLLQRMVARMVASPMALNEPESQWLFALAAMLEKPAHSDVVAALRSLTRWLAVARTSVVDAKDPQLPRINTLAVVAGAYFGQDEKLVRWVADMELP